MKNAKNRRANKTKKRKKPFQAEDLQPYYELMEAQNLRELEVRDGDFHVRLSRGGPSSAPSPERKALSQSPSTLPAPLVKTSPQEEELKPIPSPLNGVFYRAPSPASAAFVDVGSRVSRETVLCIVEAMKVMNEIRAECSGVVRKIVAENGKPVTAGQPLFLVAPS